VLSLTPYFSTSLFFYFSDRYLVLDGKEETRHDVIDAPVFSPDGKRIVYEAFDGNNSFVVLDGKEEKRYVNIVVTPVFSPDSKRIVYGALIGNTSIMVVDGKEEKQYDSFGGGGNPFFSPDSKRIAYMARGGNGVLQWSMVVDGKEEKKYYGFTSNPIFSPDSKRIAYAAELGDLGSSVGSVVVVDGKEEKYYTYVSKPIFSSDSRRVIYIASNYTNFTDLENGSVEIANFLVTNGKEGKKYYQKDRNMYDIIISMDQPRGGFTFDSADSLHYLVSKENGIYLVEEKISDVS
jgi:Tol biopolymer transport system component